MKYTFDKSAPVGSLNNPFPAGTTGGSASYANKYAFRTGFDGSADYEEKAILQFTDKGERRGKAAGSSSSYRLNMVSIMANAVAVPSAPQLTGDDVKDAAIRKGHSVALGKAILKAIAPGVRFKLDAQPARTETLALTEDEIGEAVKAKGLTKAKDIISFCANPANLTKVVNYPATPGKPTVMAEITSADVQAGQIADVRTMASNAIMDAIREMHQAAEDAAS